MGTVPKAQQMSQQVRKDHKVNFANVLDTYCKNPALEQALLEQNVNTQSYYTCTMAMMMRTLTTQSSTTSPTTRETLPRVRYSDFPRNYLYRTPARNESHY